MTIPHRAAGSAPDTVPLDVRRVRELESAADQTYRVLRAAQGAYEMACRDSDYDNLDEDPHVIATRELRDGAERAHAAAQDRLDDVLTDGPTILTAATTTPQSRRALGRWADARGGGEELAGAVRQIVTALARGRTVKIEVI
jgi:fermentation-respiration switch protein FrsA (DUF1100 family)